MSQTAQRREARLLGVELAVAGLGFATVAVAIATGIGAIQVGGSSPRSSVIAGLRLTYPVLSVAAVVVLLLAAAGIAVAVAAVRLAVREAGSQRRVLALLPGSGGLPGHPDVVVITEPKRIAFCGLLHVLSG